MWSFLKADLVHSLSRVVIIMVTGHYNSFLLICSSHTSLLLYTLTMSTPALHKPAGATLILLLLFQRDFSCPIPVLQFSTRVRLRLGFGLGTCYRIYLYILCFYWLPYFSYWHKPLKFAMQSVWKELTRGEKNASCRVSVCWGSMGREGRCICDYIFFHHFFVHFCLESWWDSFTPRSILQYRVNSKVWFIKQHSLTNIATLYFTLVLNMCQCLICVKLTKYTIHLTCTSRETHRCLME